MRLLSPCTHYSGDISRKPPFFCTHAILLPFIWLCRANIIHKSFIAMVTRIAKCLIGDVARLMKLTMCGLVILTLLLAVFLVASAVPARADVITMGGYVTASYMFDVDSGQMVPNASADLWYHNVDGVERYLVPENGAVFANFGMVDFDSVTNLSAYPLSSNVINASTNNNSIPVGTVLVVKTNLGNYAKMRIDNYPDPINFTIVYQTDGTPTVPELPSMIIIALFLPATVFAAIVHRRRRRD